MLPASSAAGDCCDRHLFAYGSLVGGDIMAEVVGARLQASAAILPGCRRLLVRGANSTGLGGRFDLSRNQR